MIMAKKFIFFAVCAVIVLAFGFATARYFNASEAQSARNEVLWQHSEIPLKTANSEFKINLPSFSQESDWLVAVKPVGAGEKEKMYIGVFTWEDEKSESARRQGFKRLSKMEDYPQSQAEFVAGGANLTTPINSRQTLVIYMEISPSTNAIFNENGEFFSLNASDGDSYVLFDGKIEKAQIQHTGSLIATVNVKKLRKEISKHGFVKDEQKEEQ